VKAQIFSNTALLASILGC